MALRIQPCVLGSDYCLFQSTGKLSRHRERGGFHESSTGAVLGRAVQAASLPHCPWQALGQNLRKQTFRHLLKLMHLKQPQIQVHMWEKESN